MHQVLVLARCASLALGLGDLQDDPVTLAPGETRTVTVLVDRSGVPEGQALHLAPGTGRRCRPACWAARRTAR